MMLTLAKSTLLGATLLAGAAFAAHAQSGSVAALPPGTTTSAPATAPVGPSTAYPGPNPGSAAAAGTVTQQAPVVPSPQYVGPSPGAGNGIVPPKFEKSADYDTNPTMHPYTNPSEGQTGPRPN
jgi:hypothetical protein